MFVLVQSLSKLFSFKDKALRAERRHHPETLIGFDLYEILSHFFTRQESKAAGRPYKEATTAIAASPCPG